jgi:hypothetical protein
VRHLIVHKLCLHVPAYFGIVSVATSGCLNRECINLSISLGRLGKRIQAISLGE